MKQIYARKVSLNSARRILSGVKSQCFLASVLLAVASCDVAPDNVASDHVAPGNTANESALRVRLDALGRRCGLQGHIAYELDGNILRVLGSDPRLHHPNFDSCFLSGIDLLNLELGPVRPREYRFMGPPEARPDAAMLDQIEARLAHGSCARDVARWWREYAFPWPNNRLETRVLRFALHGTLPPGENPGRTIYDSDKRMVLSDAPGTVAFGTYDTVTRRLSLEHCGSNYGPGPLRPQIVP